MESPHSKKAPTSRSLKAAELRQQFWGTQTRERIPEKFQYDDEGDTENLRLARGYEAIRATRIVHEIGAISTADVHTESVRTQDVPAISAADTAKAEENSSIIEEYTSSIDLPSSFEDIRHRPGKKIEDLALNPDWESITQPRDKRTLDFIGDSQKVMNYEKQVREFTDHHLRLNPYPAQRQNATRHIGWMQHDSTAFVRDRVENNSKDQATSRIYFNPPLDKLFDIYEEVYTRAEDEGLRFKAKVHDFYVKGFKGDQDRENEWLKRAAKGEAMILRRDPILFYGYEDSTEALYEIARDVYQKYSDDFKGRELAGIPCEIAPGFGVGEEPGGFSGVHSLTSHREAFVEQVKDALKKHLGDRWDALAEDQQQQLLAKNLRKFAPKANINPDNIAFGLSR